MNAASRLLNISVFFGVSLAVVGCAKDPSKEVVAATVAEPSVEAPAAEAPAAPVAAKPEALAPPAVAPLAAAAGALPLSGTIHFIGSKVTRAHDCEFKTWSGTVALADGKAEGGALNFTVQVASLEADVDGRSPFTPKLESHLKSDEFFDIAKFPTAAFASTEIKAGGDKGATHTIKGNLTMRGTTKEVVFPASITVAGKDVLGKAEFSINRKDFGIVYPGQADDLIRDGVVLKIDAKATQP